MAVKIIGINPSTGQPFQITNATKTNFGNPIGQTDGNFNADTFPTRTIIFFPDILNGRMKCFAYVDSNSTTCYIRQSFEWLQSITHGTVTNGPWTVGDGVSGGTSGAVGVIREVTDSTHIVVEITNSTAFQAEVITGTGTGSGKSCTSSAVTGTDICDAWYNVNASFAVAFPAGASSVEEVVCGGFQPFYDGTDLKLAFITNYYVGNKPRMMSYDPAADSWTSHGALTGSRTTSGDTIRGFNYKGEIFICDTTAYTAVIDPSARTIAAVSQSGNPYYGGTATFFTHEGSLFLVAGSNARNFGLWEYTGGGWTNRALFADTDCYGTGGFTAPDGTMILIRGRTSGVFAYSVNTSTWTLTDITSNLPSGYSALGRVNAYTYKDRNTNGATGTAKVLVHFSQWQTGGGVSVAECTSPTSWTDLGSFSSARDSVIPESDYGDGDFLYEPGVQYGVLTGGLTAVPGGQQFAFRVIGDSSSVNFELLVSDGTMGAAVTRGTLSSPSEGSITDAGKKISGVTSDGGLVTAVWNGSTDGFSSGDYVERKPFISV
jgi:hypothetical protein